MHHHRAIPQWRVRKDVGRGKLQVRGARLQTRGWESMRKGLWQLALECVFVAFESKSGGLCILGWKQRVDHLRCGFGLRCRCWWCEVDPPRRLLLRKLSRCLGRHTWSGGPSLHHGVVRPLVGKRHPLKMVVGTGIFHCLVWTAWCTTSSLTGRGSGTCLTALISASNSSKKPSFLCAICINSSLSTSSTPLSNRRSSSLIMAFKVLRRM